MEKILANVLGQEKQLLLSRLLARLAHEIRNPLSSLDIHVQLLEEDLAKSAPAIAKRTASRFDIIRGELHRLDNIVKQFISLSGPSALNLQPLDVAKVVGHVCELLRPEAAARGVDILMRMPAGLPRLFADEVQLTQAMVNLVINAIQAIAGRGRVEVNATISLQSEEIIIQVRDTGPGVTPERQSAIFELFFTTKAEGSGLGLWIVQQIITAHGGVVDVANAPGGGAIFTVRLPLHGKETGRG